jgi:hypothetical protein
VRKLLDGQDVEALVVQLDELPIRAVEQRLAPGALVAPDPRVEHEVVVAGAGNLERVELEASETCDDVHHRGRLGS